MQPNGDARHRLPLGGTAHRRVGLDRRRRVLRPAGDRSPSSRCETRAGCASSRFPRRTSIRPGACGRRGTTAASARAATTNSVTVATSADGRTWTPPARVTRGRNAYLPAIGIHPTSGRVAIVYYVLRPGGGIDAELVESRGGGAPRSSRRGVSPRRRCAPEWIARHGLRAHARRLPLGALRGRAAARAVDPRVRAGRAGAAPGGLRDARLSLVAEPVRRRRAVVSSGACARRSCSESIVRDRWLQAPRRGSARSRRGVVPRVASTSRIGQVEPGERGQRRARRLGRRGRWRAAAAAARSVAARDDGAVPLLHPRADPLLERRPPRGRTLAREPRASASQPVNESCGCLRTRRCAPRARSRSSRARPGRPCGRRRAGRERRARLGMASGEVDADRRAPGPADVGEAVEIEASASSTTRSARRVGR